MSFRGSREDRLTAMDTNYLLGTLNLREWTKRHGQKWGCGKQEWTIRHHVAGVNNAGVDNAGVVKCP